MTNYLALRVVLAALFTLLAPSVLNVPAQTCDNPDSKIVSDIYARAKADKSLASQISHLNVIALYGAVRLQGWTNYTKDYDRLMEMALTTSCVRLVNPNSLSSTPPPADSQTRSGNGCSSGMKACGDICIPDTDVCNISAGG